MVAEAKGKQQAGFGDGGDGGGEKRARGGMVSLGGLPSLGKKMVSESEGLPVHQWHAVFVCTGRAGPPALLKCAAFVRCAQSIPKII